MGNRINQPESGPTGNDRIEKTPDPSLLIQFFSEEAHPEKMGFFYVNFLAASLSINHSTIPFAGLIWCTGY